MKLRMTVDYGDDICEALKEAFGCSTDEELLVVFKAVMKASLAKDAIDPEDITVKCEKID